MHTCTRKLGFKAYKTGVISIALFMLLNLCSSAQAQVVESQVFGAWSVSCGPQNCAMTQVVAKDAAATQVMLGVSISYAFDAKLGTLLVRVPGNINMDAGIGIKVDDNAAIQVPFSQCNTSTCQSAIGIDEILLKELSNGKVAKFAYATKKQQQFVLPISLSKFSEAYGALTAKQALLNEK